MGTLNERSNEIRLKRQKIRKRIYRIVILILAIVAVATIAWFVWNSIRTKEFTNMEKVSSYDRVDSSGAKYCDYNGNLLKYSRDGISALDEEGNILWNGSYEMNNPMVDICGG